MKKYGTILLLGIICSLLMSCDKKVDDINTPKTSGIEENISEEEHNINIKKYSVWITYWQTDNLLEEVDYRKEFIENICYFAAYFDEEKKLFIPEKTNESYEMIKKTYGDKNYGSYLTFVNDLLKVDGTSSLKDTALLYELFSSDKAIDAHISQIVSLAESGGFNGIEIDYEAIKGDMVLWELFVDFLERLNQIVVEKEIPLRIVLEPSFPAEELTLPEGPEYVIMCYNLYGYGTEPGPKADKEFLLETIQKMKSLPGIVNFALATGGFDFGENGKTAQVTQVEATELLSIYDVTPIRDEGSGSLVFTYTDDEKISHEVWYADQYTIEFWAEIISEEGDYGLTLWRLGGNQTMSK